MYKIKELLHFLDSEIKNYENKIVEDAIEFQNSKDSYRNIQYSNSFCMILRKGGFGKTKAIGFPFPLISYPLEIRGKFNSISIHVCLRGEILRGFQRKHLIEEMQEKRNVKVIEIDSLQEFRKITKEICERYEKCNYFDPYSFIGDSYIGAYIIDNFLRCFNLKLNLVYSENHTSLDIAYQTRDYVNVINNFDPSCLAIFSDFIDIHWDRTKHLVKNLALKGIPSIICGRNIIVVPHKTNTLLFHLKISDILLRDQHIEDYMDECLEPFLIPSKRSTMKKEINSPNLIVNPFGSDATKDIPVELVFEVIKEYRKIYPQSKIVIIAGFRNSYSHMTWCAHLKGKFINENLNKPIIFKNYGSLSEIKEEIEKYGISLGLTADTSIAHLFNFLGLRNITIFNLDRCDISSAQSLASDGPLGFCRYGEIQYPALLKSGNSKELSKPIVSLLDYFISKGKRKIISGDYINLVKEIVENPSMSLHEGLIKKHHEIIVKNKIEWIKNLFDPDEFIKTLKDENKKLIRANWKICPLTKLGGLE